MITLAAIYLLGCAWLAWAAHTAPLGYQDADGFHYGEPE